MKKALVHKSTRHSKPVVIDISTEKKKREGFLYLFEVIRNRGIYDHYISQKSIDGIKSWIEKYEKQKEVIEDDPEKSELFDIDSIPRIESKIKDRKEKLEEIKEHNRLFEKAKEGDWKAAKELLEERKNRAEEYWYVHEIVDPEEDEVN